MEDLSIFMLLLGFLHDLYPQEYFLEFSPMQWCFTKHSHYTTYQDVHFIVLFGDYSRVLGVRIPGNWLFSYVYSVMESRCGHFKANQVHRMEEKEIKDSNGETLKGKYSRRKASISFFIITLTFHCI